MKRILLLAIACLVVAAALAPTFAAENVTIDGVVFNLPNGYVEDSSQQSINVSGTQGSLEYKMSGKVFENGKNAVSIIVEDFGDYEIGDDVISQVGDAKTINNVSGYINDVSGAHVFTCLKDGKVAIISATDENDIAKFLG